MSDAVRRLRTVARRDGMGLLRSPARPTTPGCTTTRGTLEPGREAPARGLYWRVSG